MQLLNSVQIKQATYCLRHAAQLLAICVILVAFTLTTAQASAPVSSGKTQVVAKVGAREITISEVQLEMARLGLDPTAENSERSAVQSIIDRHLFAEEAKRNNFHKRPEAMWRMETAKDQALAEIYAGIIAQAPEPSRLDIEAYMDANPTLFRQAKRYEFAVIEAPVHKINVAEVTPLFDNTSDFSQFRAWLKASNIDYTLSPAIRPAATFPEAIRNQLASYGPGDNIVLEGDIMVTIMKIMNVRAEPLTYSEGAPLARLMIRQERAQQRLEDKLQTLRQAKGITYYKNSAAPLPPKTTNANADKPTGGAQ